MNFVSLQIKESRPRLPRWVTGLVCALLGFAVLFSTSRAHAQINATPPELQHVGVNEHLNAPIPLDTPFQDHTGKPVTLRQYFERDSRKRPVVLTFAYHSCPVLCSMVLNAAVSGLKEVPWTMGKEYEVVTISIDPKESLEKTTNKRNSLLTEYGRAGADNGWHFLVGSEASIAAVADAAGFEYQYDARQQQWGHPSVVMITTPDGKMARYLYGIEFNPNDLRLGLLEASQGRSISTVEKLLLYCYHYDPQGGKYVLVAQRVMQVGGAVIAVVLFGALALFWRRELKKSKDNKVESGGKGGALPKQDDEARAGASA
ncbi:hypothetical protein AKJ09_04368 [Labilithrix luteola]|uniref:Cytochrome oxidase biogenesis protein Sco1/SenC/PrrC, copper metallochaperone n=1 Tax=Labilithrix luteola TaxID=1391654 RepID=A0A0K1PX57_9BACT|nr:SCO family protein [Labilithrix luteola]AKU97704.1 hypothetical protein AKJ09_04368 [Labilithrix luteola]